MRPACVRGGGTPGVGPPAGRAETRRIPGEAKLAADESPSGRLQDAARTPGVISDEELDTAGKTVQADRARVVSLHNTTGAARANLRCAGDMESYLRITAPFDGVVTKRNVHPGALVGPAGWQLATVAERAHARWRAAVPTAVQAEYSLLAREAEAELLPAAAAQQVGEKRAARGAGDL